MQPGGLLSGAARIARLTIRAGFAYPGLPGPVTAAALAGPESFTRTRCLERPARYRPAFRELGLSIGLAGIEQLPASIGENPHQFAGQETLSRQVQVLQGYMPLGETIENFWLAEENRASVTWTGHREINTVMLATSLAPANFLEWPVSLHRAAQSRNVEK